MRLLIIKMEKIECPICYEEINDNDKCNTPCGHSFCHGCFIYCMEQKSQCPLCRNHVSLNNFPKILGSEVIFKLAIEIMQTANQDGLNLYSNDILQDTVKLEKLLNYVKNKLNDKIESGNIKKTDLINDASELAKNMNSTTTGEELFKKMIMVTKNNKLHSNI